MHKLYAKTSRESVDDAAGSIAAGVFEILTANGLIVYRGASRESSEEARAGLVSVFRPHLQMVRSVYDQVARELVTGAEDTDGAGDNPGGTLMGALWRAYLRRIHPHRDFSAPDAEIARLKADYARALTKILTERAVRKILVDVEGLPADASTQAGIVGLFPRRVLAMTSGSRVNAYRVWAGQYFNPETSRKQKVERFVSTGKKVSDVPTSSDNLLTREQLEEKRKELSGAYRAVMRGKSKSDHAFYITSDNSLFIDEGNTYDQHAQALQSDDAGGAVDLEFIKRISGQELAAKRVRSFTTSIETREEREAAKVGASPEQLVRLRRAASDAEREAINREIDAYGQAQKAQKGDVEEIPIVEIDQKTSERVTKEIVSSAIKENVRVRIMTSVAYADKGGVTFQAQAQGLRSLRLPRSEVSLTVDFNSAASFAILPPPPPVKEEIARAALNYLSGVFDDEGFPAADVLGQSAQQKK